MRAFVIMMMLSAVSLNAQFRNQTGQSKDIRGGITSPVPGSLLGFLDRDRFNMSQSYGMSYYSGGGQSGSVGMYTNSMNFRLADPLLLRFNVGIMHQPFGGPKGAKNQGAQVMEGVELIYRPNKNFQFQAGFSNAPTYNSYNNPFLSGGMFNSFSSPTGGRFEDYGFPEKR